MIAADPDSALDAGEERVPNELSRESSALDDVPLLRGEVAFRLLVDAVEDCSSTWPTRRSTPRRQPVVTKSS